VKRQPRVRVNAARRQGEDRAPAREQRTAGPEIGAAHIIRVQDFRRQPARRRELGLLGPGQSVYAAEPVPLARQRELPPRVAARRAESILPEVAVAKRRGAWMLQHVAPQQVTRAARYTGDRARSAR